MSQAMKAEPRPALSAARAIDILDFLASFPDRGFTLSQIMRATGINVASCHAVLHALMARGYVRRDPGQKSFSLGPVLAALGDAAMRAQPLLAHAQRAAQALALACDAPVLLTAAVGDEIVGLAAIADSHGRAPGLRCGERRGLVPPIGAPFLAWASREAIAEWLARSPHAGDPGFAATMTRAMELIRERGFQVTLRAPGRVRLAPDIDEMARKPFRATLAGKVGSLAPVAAPTHIDPEADYDVVLIAAPIFDRDGNCAFSLCLGDFTAPITGARVIASGERLLAACLQAMQADRS